MKIFSVVASMLTTAALMAGPQAVVFDWGNVLAKADRTVVVHFLCDSLHIPELEFETVNLEKKKAVLAGMSDVDFWLQFAKQKGVSLPGNWPEMYQLTLKTSVGADPEMFAIIDELKSKKVRVGLLSNINDTYTALIRGFGFYASFEPCLLSCEMGIEKPSREAYEMLLTAIQLPAEEIVFIDDLEPNVEAAKKMGIDAILFESAEQVRTELTQRKILENHALLN